MRWAQVIDGTVRNRVLWNGEGDPPLPGLIPEAEAAGLPEYVEPIPVVVPDTVLPHLLRRVLRRMGLLPGIQQYIDSLPADSPMRDDWEYAPSLSRHAEGIETARVALGLTPEQLDAIWIAADQERA